MFATLNNAVQGYFENAKCIQLRTELLNLVRFSQDTAERLITLTKQNHPGKQKLVFREGDLGFEARKIIAQKI